MGQYYKAVLVDDDNDIKVISSWTYDNGAKLMEHSWVGNNFVNAVLYLIQDNPLRVAWVGDYSDDQQGDYYETKVPREKFKEYFKAAWGKKRDSFEVTTDGECDFNKDSKGVYLVNHDRKQYIDLEKYIARSMTSDGWCVNPLPLLTACGNDRGLGDFHKGNVGYDSVGLWAFDRIEITDERPQEYTDVDFTFIEE